MPQYFRWQYVNMKLIIGGAYQGKLEYAKENFQIKDVFFCEKERAELDFSKDAVYGLENFVLACLRSGVEAKDYLEQHKEQMAHMTMICTDLSQGIVPMEKEMRDLREMTGRALVYLSKEAETVIRVFCGLGHKLK